MTQETSFPSNEIVEAVLAKLVPAYERFTVHDVVGGFSNYTHLVKYETEDGQHGRFVSRRYAQAGGHLQRKARVEYNALAWLQNHQIPVPKPLLLDDKGTILGSPGIVTEFVLGSQIMEPDDELSWGRKMAHMLAKIHAIEPNEQDRKILLEHFHFSRCMGQSILLVNHHQLLQGVSHVLHRYPTEAIHRVNYLSPPIISSIQARLLLAYAPCCIRLPQLAHW